MPPSPAPPPAEAPCAGCGELRKERDEAQEEARRWRVMQQPEAFFRMQQRAQAAEAREAGSRKTLSEADEAALAAIRQWVTKWHNDPRRYGLVSTEKLARVLLWLDHNVCGPFCCCAALPPAAPVSPELCPICYMAHETAAPTHEHTRACYDDPQTRACLHGWLPEPAAPASHGAGPVRTAARITREEIKAAVAKGAEEAEERQEQLRESFRLPDHPTILRGAARQKMIDGQVWYGAGGVLTYIEALEAALRAARRGEGGA